MCLMVHNTTIVFDVDPGDFWKVTASLAHPSALPIAATAAKIASKKPKPMSFLTCGVVY